MLSMFGERPFYAQDCSTGVPSVSPTDPYTFTNEAVTRQSCPAGIQCVVTIPALSNRILYHILDHLDDSGVSVASEPMEAVAVCQK